MATQQINKSVGRGGVNAPADVEKVQTLLKSKKIYGGRVDKICGSKTITAIEKFQTHFMRSPDGRVDANGTTWKKMTGVLPMGAALPAQSAAVTTQIAGFGWPLDNNSIKRDTTGTFGMVRYGGTQAHHGWDLFAVPGTPVYATGDGTVLLSQFHSDLGNFIDIEITNPRTDGRVIVRYAHLQTRSVSSGATVSLGQQIGTTGNTGNARNMRGDEQHLHIEFLRTTSPARGEAGLESRYNPEVFYGAAPMNVTRVREVQQ